MTAVDLVIYEFKSPDKMIHDHIMMNKQKHCNLSKVLSSLCLLQEGRRGVCAPTTHACAVHLFDVKR